MAVVAHALLETVHVWDPVTRNVPVEKCIFYRARQGVEKVKQDLKAVLITNYKVWPAVQILNFSVVPVKLQVLSLCRPNPRTNDLTPVTCIVAAGMAQHRTHVKAYKQTVQVLFVNLVAVWWNCVLSMTQHK